jgi:phage terminase large subunit-like protein
MMDEARSHERTPTTSSDDLHRVPDPVEIYARRVVAGDIIAGPLVRAACQRHLNDLDRGPERGLAWRPERAMRAIAYFADVLRLPAIEVDEVSGEEIVDATKSQPFLLDFSQQFIVGSIFGWYNADGTRRFRTAFVEIGKGNGKSPLAAGIGLYMLTADGQQNAEVYASAAVKDQAKIQYRDAVNMVDASEDLQEILEKHGEKEVYNLVNRRTKGFFKPISAEKRGLDGKRVHCSLIDELHEHPSSIVADKMRAGTKGMRNALIFEITNSGFDRTSICYQHHEYSDRVVTGQLVDDSWFAYVCGMDEGDDPLKSTKAAG